MANEPLSIINSVDDKRKRAETRSLDVSLNEIADMYRSGELVIRPEYQRLFRWSESKQSQFIESLVLEMPVPPIFVIELQEGRWELIDGLQRVSTYLHFKRELNAPELDPPIVPGMGLELEGCDIVKELNGQTYESLPAALQIRLKRSFLGVQVVRKETDPRFRYYMFKRLNTGGEPLSAQEVRNCTIRLIGDGFISFIQQLATQADFRTCIEPLSEESRMRMGDVELVLRFLAFKNDFASFRHDVSGFLDLYMERVSGTEEGPPLPFDHGRERDHFARTFGVLGGTLGQSTCLRWLGDRFGGQFLMHHFEAFSLGVAEGIAANETPMADLVERLREPLTAAKQDPQLGQLTTGGGKNSPGPYRAKIDFVADRVRAAL